MRLYHEELSSKAWSMWQGHIPPKTVSFEGSKKLLILCLVDSRILYFWYVMEFIHKLIHLLWQPSAVGSNLTMWPYFLYPSKNAFYPHILAKKRIYQDTQLKGELADLFWRFLERFLFPQLGIGWWTLLIIANITSTCNRQFIG